MKLCRTITRHLSTSISPLIGERLMKRLNQVDSIKELHAHLIRFQLHTDPLSVAPVVKAYALSSCMLHKAQYVFNQIELPNVVTFNHMIRWFSHSDQPNEAIRMYDHMYVQELILPSNLTIIYVLKACGRLADGFLCQKIHVHALKLGFVSYLYVSNAMVHAYSCCNELSFARRVFDEMPERDLVSWNSLICGYSQYKRYRDVLSLFGFMQEAGVKADSVTMLKVILACNLCNEHEVGDFAVRYIEANNVDIDVYLGNSLIDMYGRRGLADFARNVFDKIHEKNLVSWNVMITGYAKSKNLTEARKLFNEMPQRDVISWTSMVTSYCQAGQFEMAVTLFREMMVSELNPDKITVASVLSACARLGALDVGKAIHNYICSHDIQADVYVYNALIDMYCKCGAIENGKEVFEGMKERDSVTWSSIITALAIHGSPNCAMALFSLMLKQGFAPIHGTFIGILLACAHSGLVEEGLEYFESMEKAYGLIPQMKHYGCVVDLLSRCGDLDRAYEFIKAMPITPGIVVWRILLSACKLHGNVVMAEIATKKLLELDPSNSGNYVLASNIYSSCDRWDDAERIRELMIVSHPPKPVGWSSIGR